MSDLELFQFVPAFESITFRCYSWLWHFFLNKSICWQNHFRIIELSIELNIKLICFDNDNLTLSPLNLHNCICCNPLPEFVSHKDNEVNEHDPNQCGHWESHGHFWSFVPMQSDVNVIVAIAICSSRFSVDDAEDDVTKIVRKILK